MVNPHVQGNFLFGFHFTMKPSCSFVLYLLHRYGHFQHISPLFSLFFFFIIYGGRRGIWFENTKSMQNIVNIEEGYSNIFEDGPRD